MATPAPASSAPIVTDSAPVPAPAAAVTATTTPVATPTKAEHATPVLVDASRSTMTTPVVATTAAVAAPSSAPITSPATRSSTGSLVSANAAAPASAPLGPCVLKKYYTCAAPDTEVVLRCEREGCIKHIHRSCSLRVTEPFRDHSEPFVVVCGKRCFNAITKGRLVGATNGIPAPASIKHDASATTWVPGSTERKKRSPWNSDGPSATVNSLSVLLGWLREPKNYARWVNGGDETKFETKAAIAMQILALIKAKGIETDRNRNDVFAKIYQLEKSFAEASEWVAANEQTLDEASLAAGARKRCAFYHDLVESMGSVKQSKRSSYGDSIRLARKRSAAESAAAGIAAAAAAALDVDSGDAVKRQHVGSSSREVRARPADVNKAAAEIQATIEAHVAAAAKSGGATSEVSTISPVLMSHSLLNAVNGTAGAPTTSEALAAFLLTNNGAKAPADSSSSTAATPLSYNTSLLQVSSSLLQAAAEKLQADAKIATVAANTALVRARKALRDEGVPQSEIDAALPLAQSVL